MMFTVPPIALDPYSVDPPPFMISIFSIMLEGNCSNAYNPISGLKVGLPLIRI